MWDKLVTLKITQCSFSSLQYQFQGVRIVEAQVPGNQIQREVPAHQIVQVCGVELRRTSGMTS